MSTNYYPFNSYEDFITSIQALIKAMEDPLNDDNTIEEPELFMENESG